MPLLQTVCNKEISHTKGVYLLSPIINTGFEEQYIAVRKKEQRVITDAQLRQLPKTNVTDAHHQEWNIRQKSTVKILEYLEQKNAQSREWILDIGCGNGWFSNALARLNNSKVVAIDVNMTELKQAAGVFQKDNLCFAYLDIFSDTLKDESFNIIIFNCCFQYFPDPQALLQRCLKLLTDDGEIHIIDSPFYNKDQVKDAKRRTEEYYQSLGFSEMSRYYHHHCYDLFDRYKSTVLYRPVKKKREEISENKEKDSPFPWIRITR